MIYLQKKMLSHGARFVFQRGYNLTQLFAKSLEVSL